MPASISLVTSSDASGRRVHRLRREQFVPRPLAEVFAFFADAGNLQQLTPPWLHFRIVTPGPIVLREGALIEYRLRLLGVPFGWRTRITDWTPGVRFVDQQLQGPYALWRHEHAFEAVAGGVRMTDTVDFALPGGAAGRLADPAVRLWLESIFDYRRERIAVRFDAR
jgi:ligand-binding SRPBCC domain-containing protein